jgi:hypothetical protein
MLETCHLVFKETPAGLELPECFRPVTTLHWKTEDLWSEEVPWLVEDHLIKDGVAAIWVSPRNIATLYDHGKVSTWHIIDNQLALPLEGAMCPDLLRGLKAQKFWKEMNMQERVWSCA